MGHIRIRFFFTVYQCLYSPLLPPIAFNCMLYVPVPGISLTIHKVQGLSLPSVTLALNKSIFSDGQAYVGLSRATTSERLYLTRLDFDAIKADPEAIAEYNMLRTLANRLET